MTNSGKSLFCRQDIADALGVTPIRVSYLLSKRADIKPVTRVAGARLYAPDVIEKLRSEPLVQRAGELEAATT